MTYIKGMGLSMFRDLRKCKRSHEQTRPSTAGQISVPFKGTLGVFARRYEKGLGLAYVT